MVRIGDRLLCNPVAQRVGRPVFAVGHDGSAIQFRVLWGWRHTPKGLRESSRPMGAREPEQLSRSSGPSCCRLSAATGPDDEPAPANVPRAKRPSRVMRGARTALPKPQASPCKRCLALSRPNPSLRYLVNWYIRMFARCRRYQPDRRAQQKNRRSHMIRPQPGSVGIPNRLALVAADIPGVYPRSGSSAGTVEGQCCMSRMAEAFRDHGGPHGQHRRSIDLHRHDASQAGSRYPRKGNAPASGGGVLAAVSVPNKRPRTLM